MTRVAVARCDPRIRLQSLPGSRMRWSDRGKHDSSRVNRCAVRWPLLERKTLSPVLHFSSGLMRPEQSPALLQQREAKGITKWFAAKGARTFELRLSFHARSLASLGGADEGVRP